ncbi:lipopolysaccharide biosynthesis protein, partial [Candidatus Neomarinimicrobiota bacterium]
MTSLRNQGASLFFGKTSAFFIQMLTTLIVVRLVSKAEYGLYQQFLLISGTLVTILGLGLNRSLYYFYPVGTKAERRQLIKQTFVMEVLIGLTFLILFIGFGLPRLQWFNLENLSIYRWHIGIYIFLVITGSFIETLFTIEKNIKFNRFFHPLDKIVRMGLIIAFIFFLQDDIALIYALLTLAGARFIYMLVYAREYFYNGWFSLPLLKNQLAYALPFGASIVLRTVSVKIDKFIVNDYVSVNDFALYSVAFISIPLLSILFTSINLVVIPQIAVYCKADRLKEAASLWRKTVLKNASIAIPVVAFSLVMAEEIIEVLYTQKYLMAVSYFRILILIFLFSMFSHGFILLGLKKTRQIFWIDLVTTAITVIVGLILIRKYYLFG